MPDYQEKLKSYIKYFGISAEHLRFEKSVHTVEEAANITGAKPDDFIKSVCMLDTNGNVIIGIVLGSDKVDFHKIAKHLGIPKPRLASPVEALEKTGYQVGGTPPFGYEALFFIDTKVMEKEIVYAGGGSENSLIKIGPKEIQKANNGKIVRIRK